MAVTSDGTAFNESRRTIRVYASCCGTLMYSLLDSHPGVSDIANPERVKGWKCPYDLTKSEVFPVPPGCKDPEITGAKWPLDAEHTISFCTGEGNICCHTACCEWCCGKGQCSHLWCPFTNMCKTIFLMTFANKTAPCGACCGGQVRALLCVAPSLSIR